jgi:hypothetical protein
MDEMSHVSDPGSRQGQQQPSLPEVREVRVNNTVPKSLGLYRECSGRSSSNCDQIVVRSTFDRVT